MNSLNALRTQTEPEQIILVNDADEATGRETKVAAHLGDGLLHRAFSVYIFDSDTRLLLQRRSQTKPLWPGYWANSCCSHPREGEATQAAAQRRMHEELGLSLMTPVHYLFKFQYHARFGNIGSEHEICSVYIGCAQTPGRVDPQEVADHRFVTPEVLDKALLAEPDGYTPWLRLAWARIRAEHWQAVVGICGQQ